MMSEEEVVTAFELIRDSFLSKSTRVSGSEKGVIALIHNGVVYEVWPEYSVYSRKDVITIIRRVYGIY